MKAKIRLSGRSFGMCADKCDAVILNGYGTEEAARTKRRIKMFNGSVQMSHMITDTDDVEIVVVGEHAADVTRNQLIETVKLILLLEGYHDIDGIVGDDGVADRVRTLHELKSQWLDALE